MTEIFLGLGSNVRPAEHLLIAIAALRELFGQIELSPVYEGAAIGFDGEPFWNLVARAETTLSVGELQAALRAIEYAHGRALNAPRFSPRAIDIDILTYGDRCGVIDGVTLPRPEILYHAFVLRPLADLAPQALHPERGETYAALWCAFDQASQPLAPVALPDSA